MTIWQALILGVVQGFTEFLPISSSGHLVIFQDLFGFTESVLTFDVFLHMATLIAILIFFGKSLFEVTRREWLLVVVGTIPAVFFGLLFKDQIEAMFMASAYIGIQLILTGFVNFYIEYRIKHPMPKAELSVPKSLGIGLAQAIAIIPAISRSGSTVAAGMASGLDREAAFRYSFLLAIPALLGAGVLQLKDVVETGELANIDVLPFLVGGAAALISGVLSLGLFRYVINHAKLNWFGWYCVLLGAGLTIHSLL